MNRNLLADYIFPIAENPIQRGIVSVNETGTIIKIHNSVEAPELRGQEIERYEGAIVPGFINSHCHLELSHLQGKIPRGTGLISFINTILDTRESEKETVIVKAMERAEAQMLENGIVAVGDISNTAISKDIKGKGKIYYHTFIELFGFEPEKAESIFEAGLALRKQFGVLPVSMVPHAPYSVSKPLFRLLKDFCRDYTNIMSIHNQESDEENKFYRYKAGDFIDFYQHRGVNINFFRPQARDSLQSTIPLISKDQKIMLVHNTYTGLKDISFITRLGHEATWCFCPNTNLYIEGRLPKIDLFVANKARISIGTDSLASNERLCILSELKTIHRHFPSIPFATSIVWATLNGAKHLGIDAQFGSIEVGKKPGLNLISGMAGLNLTEASTVKKLI